MLKRYFIHVYITYDTCIFTISLLAVSRHDVHSNLLLTCQDVIYCIIWSKDVLKQDVHNIKLKLFCSFTAFSLHDTCNYSTFLHCKQNCSITQLNSSLLFSEGAHESRPWDDTDTIPEKWMYPAY